MLTKSLIKRNEKHQHDPSDPSTKSAKTVPPAQPKPAPDRRFITAALMLVMVLASMEQTITATAMPTIIGELHGLEHYSWVAAVYLLASSVTMPLYGRLADALGRKPVLLVAIVLFLAGSALAGWAQNMTQLIVFRGLQGLGAGGIMPVVLTILGDIFTLEQRARIQGFFSAVWGSAALAGPALGATLVHHLGWRSIFYVNFPFGIIALLVLMWKYHDREKPHTTELDLAGTAALAFSLATLLALVSRLGPGGWSASSAIGLASCFLATMGFFLWHERRVANPILPPQLLLDRRIGPPLAASLMLGVAYLSLDTYVPLYVQGGKGGSAASAAGVVTPVMLMWALSGILAAPLVVRWGFRKTALVGSTLVTAGFLSLVLCTIFDAPRWVLTATLALTGLGFGPSAMSQLLASQSAVQWQQRGIITSGIMLTRLGGGAIGIGLLGAFFNMLIGPQLARFKEQGVTPAALLDPRQRALLSPATLHGVEQMIAGSLHWVFIAMLGFAALQVLVTLMMPGGKPDHALSRTEALETVG